MKIARLFVAGTLLSATFLLNGCSLVGPQRVNGERQDFNEAVATSSNQQLLLNILRLHDGSPPAFLEISNVSTQNSIKTDANFSFTHATGIDASDTTGILPGVSFTEMPTVSYAPLQGAAFANQMLEPIPLQNVYFLMRSGWPIDQIFRMTLEDINNLPNVLESSPLSYHQDHQAFDQALQDFRVLQQNNDLRFYYGVESKIPVLTLNVTAKGRQTPEWRDLVKLLHLRSSKIHLIMSEYYPGHKDADLYVETRSMLGVMFYLSKAVPNVEHDGLEEDMQQYEVVRRWLRIYSSNDRPKNSYLEVNYHHRWYYILDDDTHSKMTMLALFELFQLATGENVQGTQPVLTLPLR